jgi:hypothetical protein
MPGKAKSELIEVWLWDPGQKRAPFSHAARPLEYLPPDAPLPQVGDLLLLPPNVTGDTPEQAFAFGGTRTPFKVMEVEHVYARSKGKTFHPAHPTPAHFVRTIVSVQRLTEKEFHEDRGWSAKPGK